MTLTERRRRIREIKYLLSIAVDLTMPGSRDLDRSDALVGGADLLLGSLVDDLAKGE